jgi:antitoxin component of RelBE/YafQ-DinJ toxin-antitoxin module
MGKKKQQYQTRLDPDVAKQVDRFAEDHGLSKSEAVRRLVETGIEAGSGPTNGQLRDDLEDVKLTVRSIDESLPEETVTRRASMVSPLVLVLTVIGVGIVLGVLEVAGVAL